MANYHALEASQSGNKVEVVMHIAVPNETNVAGKTFASCIVEDDSVNKTSVLPSPEAQEQTDMTAGTLVEERLTFPTHKDITNAAKQTAMDALYNAKVIEIQDKIRQRYKFWGFSRDVPV